MFGMFKRAAKNSSTTPSTHQKLSLMLDEALRAADLAQWYDHTEAALKLQPILVKLNRVLCRPDQERLDPVGFEQLTTGTRRLLDLGIFPQMVQSSLDEPIVVALLLFGGAEVRASPIGAIPQADARDKASAVLSSLNSFAVKTSDRGRQNGANEADVGSVLGHDAQNVLLWLQGEIAETIAAIELHPKTASAVAAAWMKEEYLWQAISTPDYSMEEQFKYIADVLRGAVERRQAATARGATGRADPRWAEAALIECWALLLVGIYQGRWNLLQSNVADVIAELNAFARRRLSSEERKKIRALVIRLL